MWHHHKCTSGLVFPHKILNTSREAALVWSRLLSIRELLYNVAVYFWTVRQTQEHARWEMKALVLAIMCVRGFLIRHLTDLSVTSSCEACLFKNTTRLSGDMCTCADCSIYLNKIRTWEWAGAALIRAQGLWMFARAAEQLSTSSKCQSVAWGPCAPIANSDWLPELDRKW